MGKRELIIDTLVASGSFNLDESISMVDGLIRRAEAEVLREAQGELMKGELGWCRKFYDWLGRRIDSIEKSAKG